MSKIVPTLSDSYWSAYSYNAWRLILNAFCKFYATRQDVGLQYANPIQVGQNSNDFQRSGFSIRVLNHAIFTADTCYDLRVRDICNAAHADFCAFLDYVALSEYKPSPFETVVPTTIRAWTNKLDTHLPENSVTLLRLLGGQEFDKYNHLHQLFTSWIKHIIRYYNDQQKLNCQIKADASAPDALRYDIFVVNVSAVRFLSFFKNLQNALGGMSDGTIAYEYQTLPANSYSASIKIQLCQDFTYAISKKLDNRILKEFLMIRSQFEE